METTDLQSDTFEAAAILNLQEDHLDRHGSVAVYHALKRKLLDFATVKIVGTDPSEEGTDPNKSEKNNSDFDLFKGSYFDNPILRSNGACAVKLMRAFGVGDDAIRKAFAGFVALPHRMQIVGEFDGVTWIDDSKATSISALIAGVTMAISSFNGKSFNFSTSTEGSVPTVPPLVTEALYEGSVPRVRLIAGGLAKGDDPMLATDCLSNGVAKVYLIGHCADVFEKAWRDVVQCEMCGTLETAVEKARCESHEGDCVILSPGTASFDQFKSYGERGDRFAAFARTVHSD
jgi:UDP-N-acetylmuramoylalanine--D-glutamate ligase